MIDKDELIEIIKYSSKWNKPCPKWVYKAIKATPEKTGKWRNASSIFIFMNALNVKKLQITIMTIVLIAGQRWSEKRRF